MRNPKIVLNTLCQHSKVSDYKFERLYRILFNKEMFSLPISAFMQSQAI